MDELTLRLNLLKQGFHAIRFDDGTILVVLNNPDRLVTLRPSVDGGHGYHLDNGADLLTESDLLLDLARMRGSSVPEPPPKPSGIIVPDSLIGYLKQKYSHESVPLVELIKQRDAFGRAKYGQPLMSQDGRNGVEDARQEAGDLLQYAYKVYLTGDKEGLESLKELTKQVAEIVEGL